MSQSNWMGELLQIKPDITLNELIMPGSHDAGMYITDNYPLGGGDEWAKTQGLSIADQLQAGSRYFDIRICTHDGHLRTYHGDASYGAYGALLGAILGDVKTFLNTYGKNEVIILKFSHTYKDSVERVVEIVKTTIGNTLYKNNNTLNLATTPLKDLKGKVVAVFEPQFKVAATWYNEFQNYLDISTGVIPYYDWDLLDDYSLSTPTCLTVYDVYSESNDMAPMESDQLNKLKQHGGLGKDYLFLLSWILTGEVGGTLDIKALADIANAGLPAILDKIHSDPFLPRPNIVYIDFLDSASCDKIIELNKDLICSYAYKVGQDRGAYLGASAQLPDGWGFPHSLFYACISNTNGAVPIYRYKADGRYYYDQKGENSYGWNIDGIGFYAFSTQQPGTVPIYYFIQNGGGIQYYCYGQEDAHFDGYNRGAIAFYAYPA